jgi:hypothetical protein
MQYMNFQKNKNPCGFFKAKFGLAESPEWPGFWQCNLAGNRNLGRFYRREADKTQKPHPGSCPRVGGIQNGLIHRRSAKENWQGGFAERRVFCRPNLPVFAKTRLVFRYYVKSACKNGKSQKGQSVQNQRVAKLTSRLATYSSRVLSRLKSTGYNHYCITR